MNAHKLNSVVGTVAKLVGLSAVICAAIPGMASAGFMSSSMGTRVENGNHYIRIPTAGTTEGIEHELNPAAWYAYRVKIQHEDAQFPNMGWTSDNFTPTADIIQLCNVSGCEAPEINVGPENLDWSDYSKITLTLEAKTGVIAPWQSYNVTLP